MAAFESLSAAASTITQIFRANQFIGSSGTTGAGTDGDAPGCVYVTCVSGANATFIAYDIYNESITKRTLAAGATDYLYGTKNRAISRVTATGASNAATVVSVGTVCAAL